MKRPVRPRETGYALLFILLTMAIVGIMLYAAMPRVVFEAQRDQEQMLIDRGEQYKRAIQLYYRKFKKYPSKIEDLENTSNQRFLRKRYKDPMTGKDEWRLVHIGPNGQFIDSLTQKSNQKKQDPSSVNNFITELKPIGDGSTGSNAPVNPGMRRRPSDQPGAGAADNPDGGAGATGNGPGNNDLGLIEAPDTNLLPPLNNNPDVNNPGVAPPLPAALMMGRSSNAINNPNNPNAGNFNNASNFNNGGNFNNGFPNQIPQPGQNPSGANMIQNLLTSPRPGGPPPGIFGGNPNNNQGNDPNALGQGNQFPTPQNPTPVGNAGGGFNGANGTGLGSPLNGSVVGGGQTIGGGGIAGFASKAERPGIKIYNEKTKYNEWEFIYDYAKDKTLGGGQLNIPQNNNGLNNNNSTGNNTPGSPFGNNQTGTATGSAFGSSTAGGNSGNAGTGTATPASPSGP